MAKFNGQIGFALQIESVPGVYIDEVVEKNYRGDVIMDQRRFVGNDKVNDNTTLDNSISILANAYVYKNIGTMKYVVWNGIAWKIKSFSINTPRIIIQIGEVYNG